MTIRRSTWYGAALAILSSVAISCSAVSAQRGAATADGAPPPPDGSAPAAASAGSPPQGSQNVSQALGLLQELAQAYNASRSKTRDAPAGNPPAPAPQPGSGTTSATPPPTPPVTVAPPPGGTVTGCPDLPAPGPKLVPARIEVARLDPTIHAATAVRLPARAPVVAAVRGTVRAENGTSLANAVVVIAGERAVTDAKGAFVVQRSPTGRQGLLATAKGFTDRCVTIDVPVARDLVVTLVPAARALPKGPAPKTFSRALP